MKITENCEGFGVRPKRKFLLIKHLLTMTSRLEWNEEDYYKDRSKNDVYIMIESSKDYIQYVLKKPIVHEPGTHWYYSSGDSMLLSGIIEKSTNMSAFEFAKKFLVIVRLGNDSNPYNDEWIELEFLTLVIYALNE